MLAYGSSELYFGSSIQYSPSIWQNGSFPSLLLHQLGKRVWSFSKTLSMYASRTCRPKEKTCHQKKRMFKLTIQINIKQGQVENLQWTLLLGWSQKVDQKPQRPCTSQGQIQRKLLTCHHYKPNHLALAWWVIHRVLCYDSPPLLGCHSSLDRENFLTSELMNHLGVSVKNNLWWCYALLPTELKFMYRKKCVATSRLPQFLVAYLVLRSTSLCLFLAAV